MEWKMQIPMGSYVKDIMTGFEGIISAYTHHITGCDVVAIKARDLDKDGKVRDPLWVDINRVKVLGPPTEDVKQMIDGNLQSGQVAERGGGPQDEAPEFSDV